MRDLREHPWMMRDPFVPIYIDTHLFAPPVDPHPREGMEGDCSRGIPWGYSSLLSIEPLSLILLVQPSDRTCKIDATYIANSMIEERRKEATIWHQISGGVERAAVISGKTRTKRRWFVRVSTERPLGSGKRITMTGTWEHTDGMNERRRVNRIWS